MPRESAPAATPSLSPGRLWAEQLAIGSGLLVAVLIFMAIFHAKMLSSGAEVLGPNDLDAYGWASLVGIILQAVVHELGTLFALWRMKVPIQLRFFCFGANAAAALGPVPRNVWRDAVVGLAGPLTGVLMSLALHGVYEITKASDVSMHTGNPFFLGMACVGYFYTLFTLIPILLLEGGWIAPAIAPQAWLLGLIGASLRLSKGFNLVLLCVLTYGAARFILLLRARLPRADTDCTVGQRVFVAVTYFVLVIGLAWISSKTFDVLPELVLREKGD